MTMDTRNRRFSRVSAAMVGVVGLAAMAIPLAPATAQVYFGFGPGGFVVGVGAPATDYYAPYYDPYYAPHYYYPHYYHRW